MYRSTKLEVSVGYVLWLHSCVRQVSKVNRERAIVELGKGVAATGKVFSQCKFRVLSIADCV